jgi:hypothetical protein
VVESPGVERVLHHRAAAVDVVAAAVPVLREGGADSVVKPLMRDHLVQPERRAHPRGTPEQPAPRKFALAKSHI